MSRVIILMYHVIDVPRAAAEQRYCCSPHRFAEQMRYLCDSGRRLLSLDELAERMERGVPFDDGSVAVTFDDGFDDTVKNALPVLQKCRVPATMFLLSDRFGAANNWADGRGFPRRGLLTLAAARELLAAGVTVGSHTRTHPRLTELDEARVEAEVGGSKSSLEAEIGGTVQHFAYPFGLFDDRVVAAVRRAGFRTACSTRSGFNRSNADPYTLRRIEVFGTDSMAAFKRKLQFGVNDPSIMVPARYYASRIAGRFRRVERKLGGSAR
jgi:peptidoglycan/xylan/chitin deacetylase (PgdA/CDA1 family)